MSNNSKFVIYGFNGEPKQYYTVSSETIQTSNSSVKETKPGHSIIIVDRSGSMYNDIDDLKDMLIKLLTLDEYHNSNMLVSLVSYSTQGNCALHFERIPVAEVMKAKSPYQLKIKSIKANGLTCISQAMMAAKELIRNDEPTAIVLHSDGYANHPSVWSEQQSVMAICDGFKNQNVFINTVAYSDSSDFTFLSSIANAASGKCVKADSSKEVYDAFYDAASTINGSVVPPVQVETNGADYISFISKSKQRVNGGCSTLTIAGLSPDDDGTVYRYRLVDKQAYDNARCEPSQNGRCVLAFARAKLAEGRINEAKFAAYSSCIPDFEKHFRALTGSQIAMFSKDIENVVFQSGDSSKVPDAAVRPVGLSGSTTIVKVLETLESVRSGVMLNLKHLKDHYSPRGVRRIPGIRTSTGVEVPWLVSEETDDGIWVPMGTFDFNRNSASINMLITRPARLVKLADGRPISEVAGIDVSSLSSFHNYTIVGDGDVTVPELVVKFGSREAFDAMKSLGVVGGEFNQEQRVIQLSSLPVTSFDFNSDLSDLKTAFRDVIGDKVVSSILSAITKETSSEYTPEQLSELKRHYLSGNLNINFPTTTEYDDLETALDDGVVDTRTSYKVNIGDAGILNTGWLYSANEFLARHFMLVGAAKASDKPKWTMFLNSDSRFQTKPPSAKMKLNDVDAFCKPIFEEFLGLSINGTVSKILKRAGVDKSVMDLVRGGVKALDDARHAVESHMESIYRDKLSPLVFFVGSTGLLPDCFDAKGLTSDELEAQITGLKLGKDEKDGMFFRLGDVIVSVYAKNEYYSTGHMSK